jgi:hypothetical protein
VNRADFLDGLRRCDILHFAGHVEREEGASYLRFADGRYSARQIGQLSGRHPFPSLVFMNGCRSSYGPAPSGVEDQDRAFDMASAFLLSGARHFVGTLWDIQDVVGAQAGIAFFRRLFSGMPVGAALTRMRRSLIHTFGESTLIWAGYVLYGDPGFRLEGRPGIAERFCQEMEEAEVRRSGYLDGLGSPHGAERLLAATALFQMGDPRGRTVLLDELHLLRELLESDSLRCRRQGAVVLKILGGEDMGYRPEDDAPARERALHAFEAWRASERLRNQFE